MLKCKTNGFKTFIFWLLPKPRRIYLPSIMFQASFVNIYT